MSKTKHVRQRTPITVAEVDHEQLTDLALAALGKAPGAALLFQELARAKVVAELPSFVLAMGDVATFTYNGSRYHEYALVYPRNADFAQHRISVVTPVGAMLLGLAEGQAIEWTSEDGVTHHVYVEEVKRAAPAGAAPTR